MNKNFVPPWLSFGKESRRLPQTVTLLSMSLGGICLRDTLAAAAVLCVKLK